MTGTLTVCLLCISFPLWLFNLSVLIFLIVMRRNRVKPVYKSSFFTLIIILTTIDTVSELFNMIMMRMVEFDALKPMYLAYDMLPTCIFATTGYCLYTQCCLNFCIAVNRLWTVHTASKQNSTKWGTIGRRIIYFVPLTGIALLGPRLYNKAVYTLSPNNELLLAYKDPSVRRYQTTVAAFVPLTTCITAFILNVFTVIKYRTLTTQSTSSMSKDLKAEFRLFSHAIVVFLTFMLMCTIEVAIYISTVTGIDSIRALAMPQYSWANDLLNLISGPALLIISANTRRDYLRFLKLGRFGWVSESTVIHVSTFREKTITEKQMSLPTRLKH